MPCGNSGETPAEDGSDEGSGSGSNEQVASPTEPRRRRVRRTTTRLAVAAVFALWTSGAGAGADDRSCKAHERDDGDQQLSAIAGDSDRRNELIREHLPFGRHASAHAAEGGPQNEELLVQVGYVTLHDGDLRTALWIAHRLTEEDVTGGEGKGKVKCFRADERLTEDERAEKTDYERSGYARGHLAADRDLRDDLTEQVNSYVMSNMSPQYGRFNSGIWLVLEKLGRTWAKAYGKVYVTSGAIFDSDCDEGRDSDEELSWVSGGRVAVPTHFYKVFVRRKPNAGSWAAISFLLEHEDRGSDGKVTERLENALVPLEAIERHAEATFHPNLDREQLDESADWNGWRYVPGRRDHEPGCIGDDAREAEAPSHGVETVESSGDALALYDDNRDGKITCAEATRHGIAPVHRSHPAYRFMRDGDEDGIVCE